MTTPARAPAERWLLPSTILPDGDRRELWIADGRFSTAPVDGAERLPGKFALPGLVDAHAHLALAPAAGGTIESSSHRSGLDRDAGVLLVRDVGAPRSVTLELRPDPTLPRFQVAGRWHARRDRFFPDWHDPVEPEELIEAAAAEVRAGARWVKVLADWREPELTYDPSCSAGSPRRCTRPAPGSPSTASGAGSARSSMPGWIRSSTGAR